MRNIFSEASHLVRLAVLVIVCIGLFLIVRGAVIPEGFGSHGHYRPAAVDEVRTRPAVFAGQAACLACHEDQAKVKAAGRHEGVNCEACHGPLAFHVADPSLKPKITDVPALCTGCHEQDSAKRASFPQVVSKEHNGGIPCQTCHQPHTPRMH